MRNAVLMTFNVLLLRSSFKVCVYLFLLAEKSINLPQCYKVTLVFTIVGVISPSNIEFDYS